MSTQVQSTWVVEPGGCTIESPSNCTGARGGVYDSTKSSTWNVNAFYLLGAETNLGNPYSSTNQMGHFGYETIGVPGQSGVANVSLDHQVIAGIATNTYYLGNLGLSSQNISFKQGNSDTSPSFLGSLRNENLIPSLSFGYTAGAAYSKATPWSRGSSLIRDRTQWYQRKLNTRWLRRLTICLQRCHFHICTHGHEAACRSATVYHLLKLKHPEVAHVPRYQHARRFHSPIPMASRLNV